MKKKKEVYYSESKPVRPYTIHIPCTTTHRDRKELLPRWVRWLDILEKGLQFYEKQYRIKNGEHGG
jgi:hypothetical protein